MEADSRHLEDERRSKPPYVAGNQAAELDKRTPVVDRGLSVSHCASGLDAMRRPTKGSYRVAKLPGNLAMWKGGGLEKYWTDSEVFRCRGGNQQLATKLVAAIGATKVMTRMPVRSVELTQNGARVLLASGKTLEADRVILTAPPPTWNRTLRSALPPG